MKQKASGLGIEMRTFTGKSGTKYLTFKTPRGSYHAFSEVIARDACCRLRIGSRHHAPALGQAVQGRVDPRSGSSHWRGHMYAGRGRLGGMRGIRQAGCGGRTKAIEPTNFSYH